MKKVVVTGLAALVLSNLVMASDDSGWSGEAELGFVSTGGNTETDTINVKAKIKNELEKWRHQGKLESLYTKDGSTTTADRYNISGKSSYKLDDRHYLFGTVNYEDDSFSGYKYRASEALGYGASVIKRETLTLDLEVGPGARQSELDNGTSDSEGIIWLSGDLAWKVSEQSNFTETLTSEIGDDASITKSVTALKTQVNGSLAMKVSYTVKYTSDVPFGIEKNDRETAITLVYGF